MSATVLTIVEVDNYPETVVERGAWLAKLYDCDLELLLADPTASFIKDSFIVSTEVQDLAEDVHDAQERMLAELAKDAEAQGTRVTRSVTHDRPVVTLSRRARRSCPD